MQIVQSLRQKLSSLSKWLSARLNAQPLLSFFVFLGILLAFIALSAFIRKPAADKPAEAVLPKSVSVYKADDAPELSFVGKIDKGGVITIYAQTAGVVQKVNLTAGQKISRGQSLVTLSTTYGGGNAPYLTRQIAEKNTTLTLENYQTQLDLIQKQKNLAEKGNVQASELREIGRKSIDDTKGLISLNEDIFNTLDSQIKFLESTNVNGSNDAAILGAKQGKAGVAAGLNQLRSALRSTEYQTDDGKTPAQMANESKDLTIKQLELQEKSLALGKDIAELNLKLARLAESVMYPTTPCAGVVERMFANVGDLVNPGTPIATIRANSRSATAIVSVPVEVARQVSRLNASTFQIGTQSIKVTPTYVSQEATDSGLNSITYVLPENVVDQVTEGSLVPVKVPLTQTTAKKSTALVVPIDAVYQGQQAAYVYIVEHRDSSDFAKNVTVTLGETAGSFVEILSGLKSEDKVITTRGVTDGAAVSIQE